MDTMQLLLILIGILQMIMFGIGSWVLVTIVGHGNKIATLEANANSQNVEIDRRFDEMNLKLDEMKRMLGEALGKH